MVLEMAIQESISQNVIFTLDIAIQASVLFITMGILTVFGLPMI